MQKMTLSQYKKLQSVKKKRYIQRWETIGGKRYYYKSHWEIRYAKYLEFLKIQGRIKDWEYEPDIFWFHKIKSGVRKYTPDFKIFNLDESVEYHEVKGYMDSKSKTKIKRMKIYYPEIKLKVIDKSWFEKSIF